jgi:hypothetical protein
MPERACADDGERANQPQAAATQKVIYLIWRRTSHLQLGECEQVTQNLMA